MVQSYNKYDKSLTFKSFYLRDRDFKYSLWWWDWATFTLKSIYSEKATKILRNLSLWTWQTSKFEQIGMFVSTLWPTLWWFLKYYNSNLIENISQIQIGWYFQIFVAFSEYMNFNIAYIGFEFWTISALLWHFWICKNTKIEAANMGYLEIAFAPQIYLMKISKQVFEKVTWLPEYDRSQKHL